MSPTSKVQMTDEELLASVEAAKAGLVPEMMRIKPDAAIARVDAEDDRIGSWRSKRFRRIAGAATLA